MAAKQGLPATPVISMLSLADAIAASPLNEAHLKAVSKAMEVINANPHFQNIHLQEPMEIALSAPQLGLVRSRGACSPKSQVRPRGSGQRLARRSVGPSPGEDGLEDHRNVHLRSEHLLG